MSIKMLENLKVKLLKVENEIITLEVVEHDESLDWIEPEDMITRPFNQLFILKREGNILTCKSLNFGHGVDESIMEFVFFKNTFNLIKG